MQTGTHAGHSQHSSADSIAITRPSRLSESVPSPSSTYRRTDEISHEGSHMIETRHRRDGEQCPTSGDQWRTAGSAAAAVADRRCFQICCPELATPGGFIVDAGMPRGLGAPTWRLA